jgi:hypothetical protein
MLRVSLHLRPQPLDVNVDQPGIACVAVTPDLGQQRLPGENQAGATGQRHEEIEFERCERQRLPVAAHVVASDVDLYVVDMQLLGGIRGQAAQPGPDSGPSSVGLKGLTT